MFPRKGALKICSKFTEEHPCRSAISIKLKSNPTPPVTVFFTISDHILPLEIDTGASISFLNWKTFQKVNCKLNILYCRLEAN